MAVTVAINHPAFPEETIFAVDHLGEIPNGSSLEVPEENERIFIAARGATVEDAFKGDGVTTVSGSSAVNDAAEIIGDRKPPGPDQGVSPPAEEEGNGNAPTGQEDTVVMPPPDEGEVS